MYKNKPLKVGKSNMGANRRNIIELNGKHYDALTGKIVEQNAVHTPVKKAPQAPQSSAKHLDGFTKRPSASRTVVTASPKKTEKSKTLMRRTVKKPAQSPKAHAHASSKPHAHVIKTQSPKVEAVKPGRAIRATSIQQSNLISKFSKQMPTLRPEAVQVKEAPTHAPTITRTSQQAHTKDTNPTITKHAPQAVATEDPFKSALAQSLSHEQPKAKKARVSHRIARKLHVNTKVVNFAAVAMVAIAVGSFFAYQNLPELSMKLAATRAGFNASLPGYQPSGFQMAGPIEYQPGEVTLKYKSNSDERSFNVIQKNSSWNSETLLENFVTEAQQSYQTFQANGRTIYIYDNNKATWVDGGVWYNIDGQSGLNSDQLLRIANSL